jgi:hypothetical protein
MPNKKIPSSKDVPANRVERHAKRINQRKEQEHNELSEAEQKGVNQALKEEGNRKFAARKQRMEEASNGKDLSNIDENIIKEARRTTQAALNAEQGFNELAATSKQRHDKASNKRIDSLFNEIKGKHTENVLKGRESQGPQINGRGS